MLALLRYTLSDTFHAQRWVAPVLILGVIDAVASAQTGFVLPTFAIVATALLFVGTWLTVVIVNNEDPVQQTITESCAGNRAKVRLAKLLLSFLLSVLLGFAAMVPPIFLSKSGREEQRPRGWCLRTSHRRTRRGRPGGLVQSTHRASSRLVRPLGGRGWSRHDPDTERRPFSAAPGALQQDRPVALAVPILLIGLETLALCVLAVVLSIRLASSRS